MSPLNTGGGRRPPPDDIRGRGREGVGGSAIRRPAYPGGPPVPVGPTGEPVTGGPFFSLQSPFLVRPPFGVDFQAQGDGTGFTNLNTPAVVPGCTFTLPVESVGVIRSLALTVNNLLLTSDIFWRLRFNQSAVTGWDRLGVTPGAVAYFNLSYGPDETYIRVPEGSEVDVQFAVGAADAATYVAGALFHGWYFSKEMSDALERGYR